MKLRTIHHDTAGQDDTQRGGGAAETIKESLCIDADKCYSAVGPTLQQPVQSKHGSAVLLLLEAHRLQTSELKPVPSETSVLT